MFRAFVVCILLVGYVAGASFAVEIISDGELQAIIIVGRNASLAEKHAANELSGYVEKITGAKLAIFAENKSSEFLKFRNIILIGRTETNGLIKLLCREKLVRLSKSYPGADGFVIWPVLNFRGKNYFVLGGSKDYSVIYAVYDLLERWGVGFFGYQSYNEYVPKLKNLSMPEKAIISNPFTKHRFGGGLKNYHVWQSWTEKDWMREYDWRAKQRYNMMNYFPSRKNSWPADKVFHEFVFKKPVKIDADDSHIKFVRRMTKYAIMLGIKPLMVTSLGNVPSKRVEEFKKLYPKVRLIKDNRNHFYVHPGEPLFIEMNKMRVKACRLVYGVDTGVYYMPSPWAERRLVGTEKQRAEIIADYTKAMGKLAKIFKPDVFVLGSWALNNRDTWTRERTRKLMEAIPENVPLVIFDLKAEQEPLYEYHDFWYGRPWVFDVLNNYGQDSFPLGYIGGVISRVHYVMSVMRTRKNFAGVGYRPEQRLYNPLFIFVMRKLMWNPQNVHLPNILREYARLRYGKKNIDAMMPVLQLICQSIHGPDSDDLMSGHYRDSIMCDPLYQFRPGWKHPLPIDEHTISYVERRAYMIPLIEQALKEALKCKDNMKDNQLYQRDLVDWSRCLLHHKSNLEIVRMVEAFKKGDKSAFEYHAKRLKKIMQAVPDVVSPLYDRPEYSIDALIRKHKLAEKEFPQHKFSPKQVRNYMLFAEYNGQHLQAYFRTDCYELIKGVYIPQVGVLVEELSKQLDNGKKDIPMKIIANRGSKIEQKFIEMGVRKPKKLLNAIESAELALTVGK